MSWAPVDAATPRCARCGRRHGYDGCAGAHNTGAHATGAYGAGPPSGSHASTLHTGPHPPSHWTGRLSVWSTGISRPALAGRAHVAASGDVLPGPGDVLDGMRHRVDDRSDPGTSGRLPAPAVGDEHGWADPGDDPWPSVTTNPFGQDAFASTLQRGALHLAGPPDRRPIERSERSSRASFGFPLQAHTPRRARRHTVEFAHQWGLDDLVDAAELLVSELMTNALEASSPNLGRHGVSASVAPLELRLSVEPEHHLRIEVRDHNPQPPVLDEPSLDEERGRGLLLVDSYAELWGYHRLPTGGKVVWCVIGPLTEDA